MRRRRWDLAFGGLLIVLSAVVYGRGLANRAADDATEIAAHAAQLRERGWRDADGRLLPVFLHADAERWLAPVPVYATAAVMTVAPATNVPARWAAVMFGVADLLLLAVLVARCVPEPGAGVAAAVALLFTPSHLLFSRTPTVDGVWALPFAVGWAIGLTALTDRPSPAARWTLAAGTAALAALAYVQPSSALMMPMFAIVTVVAFLMADAWRIRDGVPAAATFAIVLVPLLLWFARYPSTYPDTYGRWVLHQAHVRSPLTWFEAVTNWGTASTVIARSWSFLTPSHMFLTPDARGLCGLFVTPLVVPIAAGLYYAARPSPEPVPQTRVRPIVAGCLIGPIAAAMFGLARADDRGLVIVPFGLVVAAFGARGLWREGGGVARALLLVSLVGAIIQTWACLR